MGPLTFLGIESSCDETAAAVLTGREIRANCIFGQADLHAGFGGVVPEIAARAHAERLDLVTARALKEAGATLGDLDGVAVTAGPGLIGGLIAGVMFARGLAAAAGLPLVGVNHLEGHALSPRLADGTEFPYLLLLVSGGHCQLLEVAGLGDYRRLGGTIDDAPGEAFDKVARMLGLGFPGGPEVERRAAAGDAARFAFPRPLLDWPGCDMSFSGLKTAVRRALDLLAAEQGGLREGDIDDICAGFQAAVRDTLAEKTRRAVAEFRARHPGAGRLAVAGGVAANRALRGALEEVASDADFALSAPPLALCTDNGAMIAWAGIETFAAHGPSEEIAARPRWPLDALAEPMLGSGRKGAKA